MRRVRCLLVLAVSLLLIQAVPAEPVAGKKIGPFSLPDTNGKNWSLDDVKDRKTVVVLFLGTECPINNAYLPRLAKLHRQYEPKGVQFVAINANRQDSRAEVAEHAKKNGIPFPILKDEGNVVADQFGAERTPEAFVLDDTRTIRYRGRIDDQFGIGYKRLAPTRRDLVEALDEVLAGKAVTRPATPVAGCYIARIARSKTDGKITYGKDVSRILQKNCQECHRPGQVGPFALRTYDDAAAWSQTIREVVQDGRMPPWHADPRYGKFANDRRLSPEDRQMLLAWIDQGCPEGDRADLPPPRTFTSDWRIGKPDVVFTLPQTFTVPAKMPLGGVRYQYFTVPTNFDEDRWIQAAEARPENRAVVHHIIVYARPPNAGRRQRGEDDIGQGLLVAYVPGDAPLLLEPGRAKKVLKGSTLVFQMHYTPNGVEQTDRSSVGLIFARKPPKQEVHTRAITQRAFALPPGENNHEVKSATTFHKETLLLSLTPHMHLRGKSFEYRVTYPDGRSEVLLSVPRYDFNWQSQYRLAQPLKLPAGTRIECTAHFDNSTENPNNPDPTKMVFWGEQTWEEMMIGFVDYETVP